MNPEDDGTTLSEDEMMDEEYIGAMQNLCDALDYWWSFYETRGAIGGGMFQAERALHDALAAWRRTRGRNREVREAWTEETP